ncbi:MAG TPA: ABC transporter permease [Mycobacteriales bacterium]
MTTLAAPQAALPTPVMEPAWLRWRAVYAHMWRTYTHTWRGTIYSKVLEPVLFLAAMGVGLGSLVNSHHHGGLQGLSYLDFVAPGLVAASGMQTASFEATWPVLGQIKWHRTYFGMLAGPLTVSDIVTGQLAWITTSIATSTGVYLAAAAAFGAVHSWLALVAFPAAVLTGLAFAAPVAAFAATAQNDTTFSMFYRFGVVPLFLFSGTFFPISQLPRWMQYVAYATPLWHGVALTRDLILGQLRALDDVGHLAYLVGLTVLGVVLARRTFARRLVT